MTFYAWEAGKRRPTLERFEAYVKAVGADFAAVLPPASVAPSRLETTREREYAASGRNVVSDYMRLAALTAATWSGSLTAKISS